MELFDRGCAEDEELMENLKIQLPVFFGALPCFLNKAFPIDLKRMVYSFIHIAKDPFHKAGSVPHIVPEIPEASFCHFPTLPTLPGRGRYEADEKLEKRMCNKSVSKNYKRPRSADTSII